MSLARNSIPLTALSPSATGGTGARAFYSGDAEEPPVTIRDAAISQTNRVSLYRGWERSNGLGTVYAIELGAGGPIKIGFTYEDDARERMREVARGGCHEVYIAAQFAGTIDDEARLHFYFRQQIVAPETYSPSDELRDLLARPSQEVRQFLRSKVPNPPHIALLARPVKDKGARKRPKYRLSEAVREKVRTAKEREEMSAFKGVAEAAGVNSPDIDAIAEISASTGLQPAAAHFVWVLQRCSGHVVPRSVLLRLVSSTVHKKILDVYACHARKAGFPIGTVFRGGYYYGEVPLEVEHFPTRLVRGGRECPDRSRRRATLPVRQPDGTIKHIPLTTARVP